MAITMDYHTTKVIEKKVHALGLYLHIPFCVKKCDYCDFLSAPATDEIKRRYMDALFIEIESYRNQLQEYIVPTIFIGGGTPSCLEGEEIRRIMLLLRKVFVIDESRLEATIEVNPGTITEEKLQIYREAGINRLSFGLQSVNNQELNLLGRIHTYEQFEANYQLARNVGFENINIDLMSALPGQTLCSWENTLNTVIALSPEHISAYNLIIEEGTKYYEWYREGAKKYAELPDEEMDRRIYHRTKELLEECGYHRYEISNYAKKGFKSRHNSSYWIGTDYLGIGLGASSLVKGARYKNLAELNQYIQLCEEYSDSMKAKKTKVSNTKADNARTDTISIIRDYKQLTIKERMEEFVFLGLRMCDGISKRNFLNRFGCDMDTVYGDVIKNLVQKELLISEGDMVRLTEYGIDISNTVLSFFLLD